MFVTKIEVRNFRQLQKSILDLTPDEKQDLSLLIGRNNSGKTSFIVLLEKFFFKKTIDFYDFPLSLRGKLLSFNEDTKVFSLSVQLILEIRYTEDESLDNLSEFILDLDPENYLVKILFEYSIDKEKLLLDLKKIDNLENKQKFIKKNLTEYLRSNVFAFENESNNDLLNENRTTRLFPKTVQDVRKIINLQIIYAKRNVSSSETDGNKKAPLSALSTLYFNEGNPNATERLQGINTIIAQMDETLNRNYQTYFEGFLENARKFLALDNLCVMSDLASKEIVSNYSKVIYGDSDQWLPETLSGLGYLNILYLLLQIEIKKNLFEQEEHDINLLFIEEPEAHTHPQMQYIFIKEIKELVGNIAKLQTFITTHSSHIVSQCDFKDIRYFRVSNDKKNIEIKNFYVDLQDKYKSEDKCFRFLKQYITLYASELFFAEKVIFVEGISEKILLPLFIKQVDEDNGINEDYKPIKSQNISIIEVGANAKVFSHFLEFLDIKTLIITDIDTTNMKKDKYKCCRVNEAKNISNPTIKYYLQAPDLSEEEMFNEWLKNLISNQLKSDKDNIYIAYQIQNEQGYHARSFEDSFVFENFKLLVEHKDNLLGLKNKTELVLSDNIDFYALTDVILDSKSNFASSILYLALTEDIKWTIPNYIEQGLKWIAND